MFVFCCELFFVCSFLVGTICVVVLKTVYRWPLGCKHPGARRQIQRFRCWVIFLAPLIVQYLIWRVCFFFMCFFLLWNMEPNVWNKSLFVNFWFMIWLSLWLLSFIIVYWYHYYYDYVLLWLLLLFLFVWMFLLQRSKITGSHVIFRGMYNKRWCLGMHLMNCFFF